jgi:hypothetical protein
LLLSHHAYMLDAAVLLPACLTLVAQAQHAWLKTLGVFLLAPVAHLLIGMAYPYSAAIAGLILLLLLGMCWEVWRGLVPGVRPAQPLAAESSATAA